MTRVQELLDLLKVGLPIIQAPMAGVSTPEMAAAASEAGALGSIAIGAVGINTARKLIDGVRAATSAPFNVNLFCHEPARRRPEVERAWIERLEPEFAALGAEPPDELREIYRSFVADDLALGVLLDMRPPIVSFHFGLPGGEAISAMREAGIVMIATATNLDEAQAIEAAGLDAIVAQGWEAGGHRGCFDPDRPDDQLSTEALTRMLSRLSNLPVISAGGIMDGRGIAKMLQVGAAGAQIGTVFLTASESLADEGHREALAEASTRGTVMTCAVSGRPARCLANRLTSIGLTVDPGEIPDYPVAYDLGKSLHAAGKRRGEYGYGAQWAGTGAALAQQGSTAAIVANLVRGLRQT
jgi:nitronate monooxygenase